MQFEEYKILGVICRLGLGSHILISHIPKQLAWSWLLRISDQLLTCTQCHTPIVKPPMAHPRSLIAPLSRLSTSTFACSRSALPRTASVPFQTIRCAATKAQPKKKRKARNTFLQHDLKNAEQFSLIDAMQYVASANDRVPRCGVLTDL